MKQLCYVAPAERHHRFDTLFQELDIVAVPYDLGQIKSLVSFISRERTLHQQDYILLDLAGAEFSQEHILSAVQLLRRFSVAQLVFIAQPGPETDALYGALANFRVSDLVLDQGDVLGEVRSCLMGEKGFAERASVTQAAMATAAAQVAVPLKIPAGLVIRVHVAGAMSRIGTTTQAIALYHYLKSLGSRPAMLDSEARNTGILQELYPEDTQKGKGEGYVIIKGIPFCRSELEHFDAYVVDMGVLAQESTPRFSAADLSVLVGGTKPWELPQLASALSWTREVPPTHQVVLLSFSAPADAESLGQYMGPSWACTAYHPEIWSPTSPAAYTSTVLRQLKDICGDRR